MTGNNSDHIEVVAYHGVSGQWQEEDQTKGSNNNNNSLKIYSLVKRIGGNKDDDNNPASYRATILPTFFI
jgi:hypothetical protein